MSGRKLRFRHLDKLAAEYKFMSEPRKTIVESTFELLAGYIVNRFYNDIYVHATENFNRNSGVSITTCYVRLISTYARAIDDAQFIPQEIKLLHEFYQEKTAFSTISLREMEDKICCCFVPPDHFSAMTAHDKDRVTVDILAHMIKLTAHIIINGGMMSAVIDDRANSQMHVRKIMDMNVNWLSEKRENLYKKFASHVIAAGTFRHTPPNESPDIVEKMRVMLAEKMRENAELASFKEKIERVVPAMQQKITELTKAAETARQDLTRGRLEFDRARADYETRLGAIDESALKNAKAAVIVLQDDVGRLKSENATLREELENTRRTAQGESNRLRAELAQARSESTQVRSELARLQAESTQVRSELSQMQMSVQTQDTDPGLLDSDSESGSESDSDEDVGLRAYKKLNQKIAQ